MSNLQQAIYALYDRMVPEDGTPANGRIHPFIGNSFTPEQPHALRIMALGINCYANDHVHTHPSWFPEMFEQQKYCFQKRVLTEATVAAQALKPLHPGAPFLGKASIYHSNAVKRWLPMSVGKHAHHVPESLFLEGAALFREELRLLAEARMLPHLVVVFGNRPWSHAWPAFGRPKPAWVRHYQPTPGALFHHLNRVHLHDGPPIFLLKLRHPTGAKGVGLNAEGLAAHPEFQRVVEEARQDTQP